MSAPVPMARWIAAYFELRACFICGARNNCGHREHEIAMIEPRRLRAIDADAPALERAACRVKEAR